MFARSCLAAVLLCAAPPALAQDDAVAIGAEDAAQIDLAVERGMELYRRDQAAWHTTDALLAHFADPGATGIMGWVVTDVPEGLRVTYWRPAADGYAGVYSAVFDGRQVREGHELAGDEARLDAEQLELIGAEQAVASEAAPGCSDRPFNKVVLPPEHPGEAAEVYLLTPQVSGEIVPLGGHYRFEVADGRVLSRRAFTNGCLDLPKSADGGEGTLVVSHLLDPVPTELHVFTMLTSHVPLLVLTTQNRIVWAVEAPEGVARIRALEVLEQEGEEV